MWWWAEVSADGTRSSGTVIFAIRARHSARRPHRTGASACRTCAVTLLRQPDIVVPRGREHDQEAGIVDHEKHAWICASRHTCGGGSRPTFGRPGHGREAGPG